MKVETKAGLFFLIGLLVLGLFMFKVEDLGALVRSEYEIHGRSKHASGLLLGDSVAIAGVTVGKVKSMELVGDEVDVVLQIDRRHPVYRDARAAIAWSGLLGTRYVDISMGTPVSGTIAPGEAIKLEEAYHPEALLTKMDGALGEVRDLLTGELTQDLKTVPPKLNKALESLTALTEDFRTGKGAAGKVDKALDSITTLTEDLRAGKGTAGKLLTSDELYQKLTSVAETMRQASDEISAIAKKNSADIERTVKNLSDAAPQLKQAVESLAKVASQAEQGKGPLMRLLSDEKMAQDLDKTFTGLKDFATMVNAEDGLFRRLATNKKLASDLEEALDNLNKVSTRLEQGEGTAGKLLRDEKAYQEFQKLLAEARDLVRSVKEQIPVGALGSVISGAF